MVEWHLGPGGGKIRPGRRQQANRRHGDAGTEVGSPNVEASRWLVH